jgi:predicted esterase
VVADVTPAFRVLHDLPPLELRPRGEATLACILVHGRERSPEDMRRLAEQLSVPGVRYVFPAASDASWYPGTFLRPIKETEPRLSAALARLETIVATLIDDGFPSEEIVVGGFSQGACLAAEFLARYPRRYGGALILTGGLVGPRGTSWPVRPELAGMPALVTSSEVDEWVPPWRLVETARWLESCGAEVEMHLYRDRDHLVCQDEIARARALIFKARLALDWLR